MGISRLWVSSSRAMALVVASSVVGGGILINNLIPFSTQKKDGSLVVPRLACTMVRASSTRLEFCDSSHIKASASSSSSMDMAEPNTKIKFPKLEKFPGASKDLSLLGVGFREKHIAFISVKVYAVGYYVDQEKLERDVSLTRNLAEGAFEKGLQIQLARTITGELFSNALNDELRPRMKSSEQSLNDFGSFFKDRNLTKGTVIYFTWIQPATLHVGISSDGSLPTAPISSFESQPLASALFDVYLGETSVSPSLKKSVADGLRELLI